MLISLQATLHLTAGFSASLRLEMNLGADLRSLIPHNRSLVKADKIRQNEKTAYLLDGNIRVWLGHGESPLFGPWLSASLARSLRKVFAGVYSRTELIQP